MKWIYQRKRPSVSGNFPQASFDRSILLTLYERIGLLELANAYCELELKSRCQQLIRQGANVDNIAALYAISLKYDTQVRFMIKHRMIMCAWTTLIFFLF